MRRRRRKRRICNADCLLVLNKHPASERLHLVLKAEHDAILAVCLGHLEGLQAGAYTHPLLSST